MERSEHDDAGKFDALHRQHSLGDEKRQELRDNALMRDDNHAKSVRVSLMDAMDQHRGPAKQPYVEPQVVRDRAGLKVNAERRAKEDREPMPVTPYNKKPKPEGVREAIEFAIDVDAASQQHGLTDDYIHASDTEMREAQEIERKPDFRVMMPYYRAVMAEALSGKKSRLTGGELAAINLNPKTGRYSPRGLEQVARRRLAKAQRGYR